MISVYLDTSSLVKAYHRETDSDKILKALSGCQRIFLSELSKIEFVSAVWKKVRQGEASNAQAKEIIRFFENDHPKFSWVAIDSEIISLAGEMAGKHWESGLRTLDSIQLACAISFKKEANRFYTSDRILKMIMEKEGLEVG